MYLNELENGSPSKARNQYSIERETKEEENNTKPKSGKQVTGIQM